MDESVSPDEFVLLRFPVNGIEAPDINIELDSNVWYADKSIEKVLLLYDNGVESVVIFG